MAKWESLRELIANIEAIGEMNGLQAVVALKAAANALQKITMLPDATKVAPENLKSAKYAAQMALNAMDKAALDYGTEPNSPVALIKATRLDRQGSFDVCSGCGTPGKCAERRKCPDLARRRHAEAQS